MSGSKGGEVAGVEMMDLNQNAEARGSQVEIHVQKGEMTLNERGKKCIKEQLLDKSWFSTTMTVFTIYALFGDDFRVITGPNSFGYYATFAWLTLIAFILFVTEWLAQVYAKPGYGHYDVQADWDPNLPLPTRIYNLLMKSKVSIGSFYFYLDLIATVSLISDIPWLQGTPNAEMQDLAFDEIFESLAGGGGGAESSAGGAARAGRASRAGARAGRILRIVRMVRLAKLFKLLPTLSCCSICKPKQQDSDKVVPEDEEKKADDDDDDLDFNMPAESHLGKTMSDLTTQRVIVGVLLMLIILPLVQQTSEFETERFGVGLSHRYFMNYVDASRAGNWTQADEARIGWSNAAGYLAYTAEKWNKAGNLQHPLLEMKFRTTVEARDGTDTVQVFDQDELDSGLYEWDSFPASSTTNLFTSKFEVEDLSGQEVLMYNAEIFKWNLLIVRAYGDKSTGIGGASCGAPTLDGNNMPFRDTCFVTKAIFDNTSFKKSEAAFSFGLTWFVIFLLGGGTMIFSLDTQRLVILPIEAMCQRVTDITDDPMTPPKTGLIGEDGTENETTVLLNTIDKIANLMRIGFGDAGKDIIQQNLQKAKDGEKLNLLGYSQEIYSIFGFCDIRNFTDTTECLQEEVMVFVNKIAYVLHGIVKHCNGAANKNIGDAFLLSWKLPMNPDAYAAELKKERPDMPPEDQDLFDKALFAFLKYSCELRRHDAYICEFSVAATQRLYQRMPGYRCAMGMGLHMGKAVEGAIGSDQKIDATYISRAVNHSEFLESSTKQYKVPLLLSGEFWEGLSKAAKIKTRKLDVVKMETGEVTAIHTFDCNLDEDYSVSAEDQTGRKGMPRSEGGLSADKREKSKLEEKIQRMPSTVERPNQTIPKPIIVTPPYDQKIWSTDPDLIKLRNRMSGAELDSLWEKGMDRYEGGQWPEAIEHISNFQATFQKKNRVADGPADWLLKFMKSHPGSQAPSDWQGYHDA